MIEISLGNLIFDNRALYANAEVWQKVLPEEGNKPAILFEDVGSPTTLAHDGDTGVMSCRYQISFVADTLRQSVDMRTAFVNQFNGWKGVHSDVEYMQIICNGSRMVDGLRPNETYCVINCAILAKRLV